MLLLEDERVLPQVHVRTKATFLCLFWLQSPSFALGPISGVGACLDMFQSWSYCWVCQVFQENPELNEITNWYILAREANFFDDQQTCHFS